MASVDFPLPTRKKSNTDWCTDPNQRRTCTTQKVNPFPCFQNKRHVVQYGRKIGSIFDNKILHNKLGIIIGTWWPIRWDDETLSRQEVLVVNQGLKYADSEYERADGMEWLTILWYVPPS